MKLVVSHASPDFDALASLALARLLHPGAVAATQGGYGPQIEAFIHLYRDLLQLESADELELNEVSELIVVDTSDPERIAPFDALLGRVPVTLYDHHPRTSGAIPAARGLHREVGATATLLTLLLRERQLPITPELASLALLGIHDDTGSLSYPSTRPEDHEAAAFLLREGASLELLGQFVHERYDEAQRELLAEMLRSSEVLSVKGRRVVLASWQSEAYLPGLAPLCSQLLTLFGADAAFVVARMEDKTLIVGRGGEPFDVGQALAEAFGGGGHRGAAFARTELPLAEARARLIAALGRHGREPRLAREVMSAPVRTVREDESVRAALELLARYGHNGLPVVDAEGTLRGIVTRRALDKASRHGLEGAPVKAFMTPKVVTASPDTPLPELEALIERHAIGRIPIVGPGGPQELLGIVTRSDLLRALHPPRPDERRAEAVLERLPTAAREAAEVARLELEQGKLYLVGGTVRDALLGVDLYDLDLGVEGANVASFASRLQRRLGGELSCHFDFGTCTLRLPSGLTLDLATTREEYYAHPGALPTVSPGPLRRDLARRDFTVNALALRLAPEPAELLDFYGGLTDLEARRLRTLHPLSFVEDPTRIVRGARLAGRLGFAFDEASRTQIAGALEPEVLARVSASRLRSELELTLQEAQVRRALEVLDEHGALAVMYGLALDAGLVGALDALRRAGEVPAESYLLALLTPLPHEERARVLTRFHWPRRYLAALERLGEVRRHDALEAAQLGRLGEPERALLRALGEPYAAQLAALERHQERRLRGQDVLDLGLLPGPAVGEVLAEVARARRDGRAQSFADELELAKRLVAARRKRQAPQEPR